jgi:ArsR family transcriptional regulator
MESLPLDDASLDAALMVLVLHHLAEPGRALAEVSRVLAPGGRVLILDMQPHDRAEYRAQMGHVWLGFAPAQLERWLFDAGLADLRLLPLPPSPSVKGPPLFAATAKKAGRRAQGRPEKPSPTKGSAR